MKNISFFSFCFILLVCLLIVCCGEKRESIPNSVLEIKTLTVYGHYIEPNHEIQIRDISEITSNDIKATFSYNKIEGEVELPVIVKNAPILLTKDVPIKVEIYVPSKKDEYSGWRGSFNAILK